jgi:hypothetical protein
MTEYANHIKTPAAKRKSATLDKANTFWRRFDTIFGSRMMSAVQQIAATASTALAPESIWRLEQKFWDQGTRGAHMNFAKR